MGKRNVGEMEAGGMEQDFAMLDGYTDSMQAAILAKIGTVEGKAEGCALLSALDPRSGVVREAFLTSDFCTDHLYPCLLSEDMQVVLEASNTIKTWLHSASEDPSLEIIRRMYALQLMPSLLEAVSQSRILLDDFVNLQEDGRQMVQEILESLLASVMILAENLECSLDQINKSRVIELITSIYEKRQFLPDDLVLVAAECLAVLSEDNEAFVERPEGIRLYSVLLGLPQDWTKTKSIPLTIRSLLSISSIHGNPKDKVYERSIETICDILKSGSSDSELLSGVFETLANMMEGLDQSCLAEEDHQMIMHILELVCKTLSTIETPIVIARGLGALTNLLILSVDVIGDNVNTMIWTEALSVWMTKCEGDEEALSGLLAVMRLLQLNLPKKSATSLPTQLQFLVTALSPFKGLHESALMVLFPLVNREAFPSGFEQMVLEAIPILMKADPEDLEELTALLDECFGDSIQPLPLRLQALFSQEDN